jgi:hypothetical protein
MRQHDSYETGEVSQDANNSRAGTGSTFAKEHWALNLFQGVFNGT